MALSSLSNGNKLNVAAVQTVVPTKPTDPRESFRVTVPHNLSSTGILRRRFHVVFCYNKAGDEDSGWVVAGRIKESLGRALQEQPLLAGRLRRRGDSGGDLEVVSNDSGVRLVEASVELKLADFLESKDKNDAEAELVFWEDFTEHNPQFSPLFYVQVTNFICGGYSIGISCSLLLVDPFILSNFLKRWADIHNTMFSRTDLPEFPTFYLPKLRKPGSSPGLQMGSNVRKNAAQTVIFKLPKKIFEFDDDNVHKNLAALCIDEAEREVAAKMASNFSLVVKAPFEDAKVEICSRQEGLESSAGNIVVSGLSCARTWDELGLENICLNEGKKPVRVSCWINAVVDEGCVMIIPPSDEKSNVGLKIIVSFT
ncbi:protein ECERIFERUM 26-like [Sesamum alatum]|uniref:Protein ECERIFERUM 26-like n=1 Tax=Sesamum alatum TaxID=300844 RepID=A0AAE1XME7_9LAMI|nr:protein ECERIFERUM 26-like [Sesamum alatum]